MPTANPYSILARSDTGGTALAFLYDPDEHTIESAISTVEIESGDDYWAILIDDDYALIWDSDGLNIGDVLPMVVQNDYPRLDVYRRLPRGANQLIATISKRGRICTPSIIETDSLPSDGMNIFDNFVITENGIYASKTKEIRLLASGGSYLTYGGKLINAMT